MVYSFQVLSPLESGRAFKPRHTASAERKALESLSLQKGIVKIYDLLARKKLGSPFFTEILELAHTFLKHYC